MTLSSRSGAVRLGSLLGKGGEGAVYALADDPDLVAKVYLKDISTERAAKLQIMPGLLTPEIAQLTAWPQDVLYKPDGRIGGFLMKRMASSKDIHSLYGPKSRLAEFPHADWRLLVCAALNLARSFHTLHHAGCLVADVNHGGIRVTADGTIRIIDCDSFQISWQGRTYLCEVGTDQFTPPELQQKSFRETPRTANHDNFGLAVMIFQLLQMGRHPFAGRYKGPEDMPIPKAIGQLRYAYGSSAALTNMEPPPHTARPHAASPEIAALWEQAFSREGIAHGGRPTAATWVAELSRLEKSFEQCGANPTHYFFRGHGTCPWCPIESIGVILFGIPLNGGVADSVGIALVWQQIQGVQNPGSVHWMPAASAVVLGPSLPAEVAKAKRTERRSIGIIVGVILFFAAASVEGSLWLLWSIIAAAIGYAIAITAKGRIKPFAEIHSQLSARMDDLREQYATKREADSFQAKLGELQMVHADWLNLPNERERRYQELVRDRHKHALVSHLDKQRIDRAGIPNIGTARSAMLESYGIETAADLSLSAILQVPGFGDALASALMDWRHDLERKFHFNPASEVDRAEVMALDRAIAIKRAELERRLRTGPAVLQQYRQAIVNRRATLEQTLQETSAALHQAEVDLVSLR
ncbi:hypothetical protein OKA05_29035 [Luteolibacter arcticus]|uniref:Protein kinase domain-containing protein n=1 Tax=Luteolibacter arcticus TaxID=1581411 RepID=A0ABT3GT00_9BACT|nr:hypothetical protein [Luteolibacter arcticus]MCW1926633.1 hypothetical protein [Luteolibacter arcticus]